MLLSGGKNKNFFERRALHCHPQRWKVTPKCLTPYLKSTQNASFDFFFQFWHFKVTCLATLFDRQLQIFKIRQNGPFWAFLD